MSKFINRIISYNKLVLICIFFTVATIVDISLSTAFGLDMYSTYAHLLSRLVLCSIPVLPLVAFRFMNEKYSIWAVLPIHFVLCSGLVMLYVYVLGLFTELHPNAYIDMFRSFAMIYVLVILGALVIDLCLTAKANKNLRLINKNVDER